MNNNKTYSIGLWALSSFIMLVSGLLILLNQWDVSPEVGAVAGVVTILFGVLASTTIGSTAVIAMLLGLYFIARSIGMIEHQYLRYILGICLAVAGVYSFYRLLKGSNS